MKTHRITTATSVIAVALFGFFLGSPTAHAGTQIELMQSYPHKSITGARSLGNSKRIVTRLDGKDPSAWRTHDANTWALGNKALGITKQVTVETTVKPKDPANPVVKSVTQRLTENRTTLSVLGFKMQLGKAVPDKSMKLLK